MENSDIPQRSSFWFGRGSKEVIEAKILDQTTFIFILVLGLSAFIIYWPLISIITFEEAFFTPLVPLLVATFGLFGEGANSALRVFFVASLVVSTCGIYLLVRDLTRRQVVAILSAVIYLVPPIPIFVLTFFRRGLLSSELESAKSFLTIMYGDGAHFLALALVPLVTLFYLRFLKSAVRIDFLLAVFGLTLVLLSNPSQALFLFLILTMATVTEMFLGMARQKFKSMLLVAIFAIGMVSFWYTPTFWFGGLAQFVEHIGANFKYFFPLPAALLILSLSFAFVFFAKKRERQPIFMAFSIFIILFAVSFTWLVTGRSFLPFPHRLFPDILMFGSVVLALSLTALFDKTKIAEKINLEDWSAAARTLNAVGFAALSFLLLSAVVYILSPLAILLVAGPSGIWTKVRVDVLADRQEILNLAGESFKLVPPSAALWDLSLGAVISLISLIALVVVISRNNIFSK